MSLGSLLAGLLVGGLIGLAGRVLVPARRAVPLWVLPAAGIGAAALGTAVAPLIDVNLLGAQIVCASAGVALVAATGERRSGSR